MTSGEGWSDFGNNIFVFVTAYFSHHKRKKRINYVLQTAAVTVLEEGCGPSDSSGRAAWM